MKKMEFGTATKTEAVKKLGHRYVLNKKERPQLVKVMAFFTVNVAAVQKRSLSKMPKIQH